MAHTLNKRIPTVTPALDFDAGEAAQKLNKAVKGLGTDEQTIIDVLSSHTNDQRINIAEEYQRMFSKKLTTDLKDDLSGDFEKLVIDLFKSPEVYDVEWLKASMAGVGTNESLLLEILCTRSPQQIKSIRAYYKEKYGKELALDMKEETSGSFKKLLTTLVNCGRDESGVMDRELIKSDTEEILSSGMLKFGTDDARFNRIFCVRSFEHLREVFSTYKEISGVDIEESIKLETGGDYEKGLLAIVKIVRNTPEYFAERLYSSMKGLGTKDDQLRRIVVTRSEVDMVNIRDEFQNHYGQPLEQFIKDDTKGDFKKLLLRLIGIRSA